MNTAEFAIPEKRHVLGVVTGVVRAISDRPRLRLILSDSLFNRAVYCYLEEEQQELARKVWRKRVAVTGLIYRDPQTGRPIEVHDVSYLEIVEEAPVHSYQQAMGVIPWQEGDELSEDIIRRMRDAG